MINPFETLTPAKTHILGVIEIAVRRTPGVLFSTDEPIDRGIYRTMDFQEVRDATGTPVYSDDVDYWCWTGTSWRRAYHPIRHDEFTLVAREDSYYFIQDCKLGTTGGYEVMMDGQWHPTYYLFEPDWRTRIYVLIDGKRHFIDNSQMSQILFNADEPASPTS